MNILLLSMPDSFEHMPVVAVRMPNGGLTSLAGNLDPHHRVAVADLILAQRSVRATVEKLVAEWEPQVLGLSVMTFQPAGNLRSRSSNLSARSGPAYELWLEATIRAWRRIPIWHLEREWISSSAAKAK